MNEAFNRTAQRRREQYRDRWSSFGERTGIVDISEHLSPRELREFEIFSAYDDAFLESISPDVAIALWRGDTVLFEEGSFIDLAFYIVRGNVEVYLAHRARDEAAGASNRLPIFDHARTSFGRLSLGPDLDDEAAVPIDERSASFTVLGQLPGPSAPTSRHGTTDRGSEITFLSTMDFDLPDGRGRQLDPGNFFGEIGAMSGWPQSVTARTIGDCLLVQIRLPALRKLRRKSDALKNRLDAVYRQTVLGDQLRAAPLLHGCDPALIDAMAGQVELISCEPEEEIAREGEPVDAVYLVRSGFVKLSQGFGRGEIVVNYLAKGMTFGEAELLLGDTGGWTTTVRSVEYAELVKIPSHILMPLLRVLPAVERRLWGQAAARVREAGAGRRDMSRSDFIDVALEEGWVQANAMLVIDLDRCTRCDDCVRACAATHDGRPRFVREGEKYANLHIASACYHCRDPVCLVGCPTGAIHRSGLAAVVEIAESVCIGCGTCARSCPYDSIVMHDTGETWPDDMLPSGLRGQPRQVASKCDLCRGRDGGPACVESCPNGCAYRIGSLEALEELVRR